MGGSIPGRGTAYAHTELKSARGAQGRAGCRGKAGPGSGGPDTDPKTHLAGAGQELSVCLALLKASELNEGFE